MSDDCLFCRIVRRDVDADIVYEDDSVIAFRDIHPQAPVHLLLVPRMHIPTVSDFREEHAPVLSGLLLAAAKIAVDQGVDQNGYRVVLNCREGAGQSVFHVHAHLLGGRPMAWPPG
jgi:histidine triad (HIT) family protein